MVRSWPFCMCFLMLLFSLSMIILVKGHGYLVNSRSNYMPNGKFVQYDCGFKYVRWDLLLKVNLEAESQGYPKNFHPGTNCGPCGDNISISPPRFREFGFPNTTRWPTRVYRQNTKPTDKAEFPNPHGGYTQLRIGTNLALEGNTDINVAQDNFNQHLLRILDVYDKYYPRLTATDDSQPYQFDILTFDRPLTNNITNDTENVQVTFTFALPANLVSDHATLQFNYISGNKCAKTGPCLQQTFRTCSDIRIVAQDDFTFLMNKMLGKCLANTNLSYALTFSSCYSESLDKDSPAPISILGVQSWANYTQRNASIVFEQSGYCMEVSKSLKSDGACIGQRSCKSAEFRQNQEWWTEERSDGYYQIMNRNSGLCLSAGADYTVSQRNCNATSDWQAWNFVKPEDSPTE